MRIFQYQLCSMQYFNLFLSVGKGFSQRGGVGFSRMGGEGLGLFRGGRDFPIF